MTTDHTLRLSEVAHYSCCAHSILDGPHAIHSHRLPCRLCPAGPSDGTAPPRAEVGVPVAELEALAAEWEQWAAWEKERAARKASDRRHPHEVNAAFCETHARRLRALIASALGQGGQG